MEIGKKRLKWNNTLKHKRNSEINGETSEDIVEMKGTVEMKKVVTLAASLFLLLFFLSPAHSQEPRHRKFTKEEIAAMKQTRAVIKTDFGNMVVEFFPEIAPNHVNNFTVLAKKGFYDGTRFHRVIPGFMIQGGDPNSKLADRAAHGTGGPGYSLKAEFNDRPHKRGTLSMARSSHPDSAGSQFFICVADASYLDGKYTVFGKVVEGMEVADKIVERKRDRRDNPVEGIFMNIEILSY